MGSLCGSCCGTVIPNLTEEKLVLAEVREDQVLRGKQSSILFLGVGGTGKSTFFKQLIRIHGGISDQDRKSYGQQIQEQMTHQMKLLAYRCERKAREGRMEFALGPDAQVAWEALKAESDETDINCHIVDQIRILWHDAGIQEGFKQRAELCIFESSGYFWNEIKRVGQPDYCATDEDCIRLRNPTTGMVQRDFIMESQHVKIIDVGGQRSERRKWIHMFEGVTAVIFVASLSGFDEYLYENHQHNVMEEQLEVFQMIINSRWFEQTPIILFLNKRDLFLEKIQSEDGVDKLTAIFPEYAGGADFEKGVTHIKGKFKRRNGNHARDVYTHVTCARDKDNVQKVFVDITHAFIRRGMNAADLL